MTYHHRQKYGKIREQKGSALIMVMILFVALSLSIAMGLVVPVLRSHRIARNDILSKQSYAAAESAVEDAYYRIKNGMQISTSETMELGGATVALTIATSGTGQKNITAESVKGTVERTIAASLATGSGIAFNYGLQAGNGGMNITGGSRINGNVYSNGDVDAISATITGTVVAAESAPLSASPTNTTPLPAPSSIAFRNILVAQDFAQSFVASSSDPINKIALYMRKNGTPSDATLRIVSDANGSPGTTTIASATLSAGLVTTNFGWIESVFPTNPSLAAETIYWIVVDNSTQHASSNFVIGANNAYAQGAAKTGRLSGSWSSTSLDAYFQVYTGGIPSLIGGATYASGLQVGAQGTGDAWASTVRGTSVQGALYCTTGLNNNKSCNTSRGAPSPQALPFSEANIEEWKTEAEAGGTITGNHTVGWAGATIGPKKITGDLIVNGGGTLTLSGTVWVEGDIVITNGGKLRLPANYAQHSGKLVSDGQVTLSGGSSTGSGVSGSYIFIVSTSKCPQVDGCSGNAITVTGGAGAIAVNAQNGTVGLSGGAALNAVVGNAISVTGGSTVTYDQGLASPSFMSGPSGGWNVTSWRETL